MDKIAASALFDVDFYLEKYPDIQISGLDPFEHYCLHGWREGRDPSPFFSTNFYLQRYQDVAVAGLNPLNHYALQGVKEGREALPLEPAGESAREVVLGARSARSRSLGWVPVVDIGSPLDKKRLRDIFLSTFAKNTGNAIVSLSHDQYIRSVGGVQAAIAIEEGVLTAAGWTYIHLCPASPLPLLADAKPDAATLLVLTLNGRREGVVRLSDILAVLPLAAAETQKTLSLIVHHLMGFSADAVISISKICKARTPILWVHDFFSLCVNPFLLRNDIAFCNAPAVDSSACMICCEGVDRRTHVEQVRYLFDELRPVVLAPSETALNLWKAKGSLTYSKAMVLPLARVELGLPSSDEGRRPLRVAHLGAPASHKGWPTFKKLVERHAEDARYEFFRLGVGKTGLKRLTEVSVEAGPGNVDAMIDATRAHGIDIVINWSSCFETFSFITLEALAAGAFVIARKDAGNVWPAVVAAGSERGIAVSTEIELRALFVTGEILERAATTLTRGRLLRSRGTADLFLKEAPLV